MTEHFTQAHEYHELLSEVTRLTKENTRLKLACNKFSEAELLAQPAQDVNVELVFGFNLDDLASVADGLEAGYESTVNTGEDSVESTTAYAARFIRTALANVKAAPVQIEKPITEARLYELYPKGFVTWESSERCKNKFTEQMEYVPVTKTDFNFLKFARVIEAEHGIVQAKAAPQQEQKD